MSSWTSEINGLESGKQWIFQAAVGWVVSCSVFVCICGQAEKISAVLDFGNQWNGKWKLVEFLELQLVG